CRDARVPAVIGEAMVMVPPVRLLIDIAFAPVLLASVMSIGAFVSVMLPELPGTPLSAIAAEPLDAFSALMPPFVQATLLAFAGPRSIRPFAMPLNVTFTVLTVVVPVTAAPMLMPPALGP